MTVPPIPRIDAAVVDLERLPPGVSYAVPDTVVTIDGAEVVAIEGSVFLEAGGALVIASDAAEAAALWARTVLTVAPDAWAAEVADA